jgi:hypothetical protein
MKTSLCALAVVCLTLAVPRALWAQSGPSSGRILVMKNYRTLEGEITCDGSQYVIRRPVGEITLPVERGQKLCTNWDEAYTFVRAQANLHDPDERLRLARWCQQHELMKQALAEAKAAAEMRPGHAESQRLFKHLQKVEHAAPPPPAPEPPAVGVTTLPAIDLDSEALSLFTTRVQPILMNACANCHCNGRGGSFQLMRVAGNTTGNRGATQHNLAAVLRRVDLERPAMSLLLIKAVSDHAGTGQAPIKKKDSTVFRNLELWLHETIASNPHLRELPELRLPATTVAATPAVQPLPQVSAQKPSFASAEASPPVSVLMPSQGIKLPPAPLPVTSEVARSVPTVTSPTPQQPARPLAGSGPVSPTERDEYDPTEFNRRAQPPAPRVEPNHQPPR